MMVNPIKTTQSYLVGGWPTPLKNDGVRQSGWWHSRYMESHKAMFHTTNQSQKPAMNSSCISYHRQDASQAPDRWIGHFAQYMFIHVNANMFHEIVWSSLPTQVGQILPKNSFHEHPPIFDYIKSPVLVEDNQTTIQPPLSPNHQNHQDIPFLLPSGKLTKLLKMAIYSGFTH